MKDLYSLEIAVHSNRLAKANSDMTGVSPTAEVIENAIVAPLTIFSTKSHPPTFDGGVYYSNGTLCKRSLHIKNGALNIPMPCPLPIETIEGTHIFGGLLKNEHFGHFVAESLSRLWLLMLTNQSISSIIFYVRDKNLPIPAFVQNLFNCIHPKVSIKIVREPTSIERLIVPDQIAHPVIGFIAGHSLMKSLFAEMKTRDERRPKLVYISRTKLNGNEGGILAEKTLENNLKEEGFSIIHPQEFSIKEQLSIYASAEKLIFAEGSAIHLYALVAKENQVTFIVRRRPMGIVFDWQLQSFGMPPPKGTNNISNFYIPEKDGSALNRAQAKIDFYRLKDELVSGGFISGNKWKHPTDADIIAELENIKSNLRQPLICHDYFMFAKCALPA